MNVVPVGTVQNRLSRKGGRLGMVLNPLQAFIIKAFSVLSGKNGVTRLVNGKVLFSYFWLMRAA